MRVEEPTMREIRYLDKLIDELARGTVTGRRGHQRSVSVPSTSP
jgi:hypothetical protein